MQDAGGRDVGSTIPTTGGQGVVRWGEEKHFGQTLWFEQNERKDTLDVGQFLTSRRVFFNEFEFACNT